MDKFLFHAYNVPQIPLLDKRRTALLEGWYLRGETCMRKLLPVIVAGLEFALYVAFLFGDVIIA